jgi:hypothetical protein
MYNKSATNVQQAHNNFLEIIRVVKRVELSMLLTILADMFDCLLGLCICTATVCFSMGKCLHPGGWSLNQGVYYVGELQELDGR